MRDLLRYRIGQADDSLREAGILRNADAQRGDLEEFDALDDYRMEFVEWLAHYKTWASLDERYRRLAGPVTPSDAPSWDDAG
jgi:hypothetical protein